VLWCTTGTQMAHKRYTNSTQMVYNLQRLHGLFRLNQRIERKIKPFSHFTANLKKYN
jgi:hypothetical protein